LFEELNKNFQILEETCECNFYWFWDSNFFSFSSFRIWSHLGFLVENLIPNGFTNFLLLTSLVFHLSKLLW